VFEVAFVMMAINDNTRVIQSILLIYKSYSTGLVVEMSNINE